MDSCKARDRIRRRERPGLGVEPDEAGVRRFAEAWWTATAWPRGLLCGGCQGGTVESATEPSFGWRRLKVTA